LVFSTESTISTDDIASNVLQYIKSMEHQLSLHPPSNIINKEQKETLRNLFESGFEEEVIADQLDLDLNTVRMLIKEL
jgi:DNA-binding NarL/FixJ family response regulator